MILDEKSMTDLGLQRRHKYEDQMLKQLAYALTRLAHVIETRVGTPTPPVPNIVVEPAKPTVTVSPAGVTVMAEGPTAWEFTVDRDISGKINKISAKAVK